MRQSVEGLVSQKLAQSPWHSPEGWWYSQPAKSCTQGSRKKSRDITALFILNVSKKIKLNFFFLTLFSLEIVQFAFTYMKDKVLKYT